MALVAAGLLWSGLVPSPAAAGTPGPGGIVSDEFNAGIVDGSVWHFVDPLGDSSLSTSPGHAVISVPGGVAHDLWTGGFNAPRLVQNVPNRDFDVEAKLDGVLGGRYQMEGIIVQQDATNLLRIEVHSDGSGTNLFVASFVDGSATVRQYMPVTIASPLYLRLTRAGSWWTVRYSSDGQTWLDGASFSQSIAVTSLGVFAGNSGDTPAFSLPIDFVRDVTPAADTTPPALGAVSTSANTLGATISWTTDEAATSNVDYGLTSSYGSTKGKSSFETSHTLAVAPLACATTYHYRVRSADAAGNAAASGDNTFTTGACPSALSSDEFNAGQLNTGLWTFVNPLGDSSAGANGSQALISVAAGTGHDIWTGLNTVPVLLQAAPNDDFEAEAKFDSAVTTGYQQQGLLVEQDDGNLLRLEVYSDGTATHLFLAGLSGGSASVISDSIVAGGSPVYLHLKRTGNGWTLRYSNDGSSWTTKSFSWALTVRAVGPYAGNGGSSPPAFTAKVDYFHYIPPDRTPPQISAIAAAPSALGATISWTTDEAATSNVDYGLTSSYGSTKGKSSFETSHTLAVAPLACATTYHYRVRSADAAGNAAASGDNTFTTGACPSALSSDEFNAGQLNTGLWTFVNPLGDSSAGANGSQALISVAAGTGHDIWTGLNTVPVLLQAAPNDDFEAEAKFDSAVTTGYQQQGLLVEQDDGNLLRLEVYSDGTATHLFLAGLSGGSASVISDSIVAGGSPVYLHLKRTGNGWTLRYSNDGSSWTTKSFSWALTVRAVGPYAGNGGSSPPAFTAKVDYFHYIPPDRTPPQISAIAAAPSALGATISWTTDEPSSSTIAYGETAGYAGGTVSGADGVRDHRLLVHGLRCATAYHFQVRSQDADGNAAASADQSFTTAACPSALSSDEFNTAQLNTGLWTFVDPLGDSSASANGSQALISVPAGTAHDVWTASDTVARLLQAAPNANLEVEAKFDSPVTTRYQQQGLLVEQDAHNLLRVEIHYDGTGTRLFVAAIMGGTADIKYDNSVPGGAPSYLHLKRTGDQWTVGYSVDGETWTNVGFKQVFAPSAIGPYAGNGGSLPAFTAKVDYFRVVPPPPPDTTPPAVTSLAALPHQVSATLTWSTDEPSTSKVEWGSTTAYGGAPVSASDLVTAHRLRLTGLACGATYHYRARSTDSANNEAVTSDRTFATNPCTSGPDIAVWNGDSQTFGQVGVPQTWINVLGNVEDPNGIPANGGLSYRLNGGASQWLTIGPTDDRLAYPGDFNIELLYSELRPGANDVEITAVDAGGHATVRHVTVNWQGTTQVTPPANGPVMVVVAHPDDEALGMAGIIDQAHAAGRKVYVAITTNGDSNATENGDSTGGSANGYCGAAAGSAAGAAARGLLRDGETRTAMALLGLHWSANLATTDIIYLGYPDGRLREVAAAGTTVESGATGLAHTYAEDMDGSTATCNGDFRYLLSGRHSDYNAPSLASDLDALLNLTHPSDIYTHSVFDGNPDHSKVESSLMAAVVRQGLSVRVHETLIHPEGTEFCQALSAAQWPNPPLVDNDPFARFTPWAVFTAPPVAGCDSNPTGSSWGSPGAPNEQVDVPAAMQAPTEANNFKWQVISKYQSQIDCSDPSSYNVNCGFMRAFAKHDEFFWTKVYGPPRQWPMPYTASWTSAASISQQAQIIEGQWVYDGKGIRPAATGFDRLVTLGDMHWANYDVTAEMTFNSFDLSRPIVGATAGLVFGWQGHTAWGQPHFGHPSGGACDYGWDRTQGLYRLELTYSPGPANDTTLATTLMDLTPGLVYKMRFRESDLGTGATRYSCKVWPKGSPEPSKWALETDTPYWAGETGTHPGAVILLAHNTDVTFGDVTVAPAGN